MHPNPDSSIKPKTTYCTCTAPVALFTVELNSLSFAPASATLDGTSPLFAPVVEDDPAFAALAFIALRFLPREVRALGPPLVACGVGVFRFDRSFLRLFV